MGSTFSRDQTKSQSQSTYSPAGSPQPPDPKRQGSQGVGQGGWRKERLLGRWELVLGVLLPRLPWPVLRDPCLLAAPHGSGYSGDTRRQESLPCGVWGLQSRQSHRQPWMLPE